MRERGLDFANLVYHQLVVEKQRSVDDVAAVMGMTYASLHARLINRTAFSADEIRALLRAVPDRRLVAYLLDGSPFVGADRVGHERTSSEASPPAPLSPVAIQHGATRVVVESAAILGTADTILSEAALDRDRLALLKHEIEVAEHALASLRMRVETMPPSTPDGTSDRT